MGTFRTTATVESAPSVVELVADEFVDAA